MSAEKERARLIRYEALFELAGGINTSRTYAQAAKVFASRLKFATDVFSWRYLSVEEEGQSSSHRDRQLFIIDGYQGQATISETYLHNLSRVEVQLWEGRKACFIEGEALLEAQATLPKLFQRGDIQQLYVYPIFSKSSPQSLFICSNQWC